MQRIAEHVPVRPRKHSAGSQESNGTSIITPHQGESPVSTSAEPAGSAEKPHTLSGIAHRAIGDHATANNVNAPGSKHNKRQLSGDQQDPAVVGGEHPGLDRSQSSGRFSKGMPSTPWTNTKVKEMRQEQNGETEESPEDREKKEIAVEKIRHVMGVSGMDSDPSTRNQDERETKEDKDENNTREAIEKLSLHAERQRNGHGKSGTQQVASHDSGSFLQGQTNMDIPSAQKPTEEHASYPINNGSRPDHRQEREANSGEGDNGAVGDELAPPAGTKEGSESSGHSRSKDSDMERLPPRAPKEGVNGDVPEAMAPSKDESPPGPRNDINLRPRIPDMQVRGISFVK